MKLRLVLKEAGFLPEIKKKTNFGSPIGKREKTANWGQRIGDLGDYRVFRKSGPSSSYSGNMNHQFRAVSSKTGKTDIHLNTYTEKESNHTVHHIDTVTSSGKGPKAPDFYHHLLKHHVAALVGHSHSPGGQKIWQRLAKKPGVSVHGWDTNHEKPVNIDPQDDTETHAHHSDMYDYADKKGRYVQDTPSFKWGEKSYYYEPPVKPDDPGAKDTRNMHLVASYHKKGSKRLKDDEVNEEAPTNSVGSGQVAGLGVGSQGEPPGPNALFRKGKFAGHPTFIFSRKRYNDFASMHKKARGWWKNYLGEDDPALEEIRQYANKNPKAPIIFECGDTGRLFFARYGALR